MKAIIQKVIRSSVTLDNQIVGSIGTRPSQENVFQMTLYIKKTDGRSGKGYNVLLGIGAGDTSSDADWVCVSFGITFTCVSIIDRSGA